MTTTDYDKEKKKEFYGYILSELESAEQIIRDYLTFAKPTYDKVSVVCVEEEVTNVISIIQPYASLSSVVIHSEGLINRTFIECDPQSLKQCLINIVRNSIEATEESGQISFYVGKNNHQAVIKIKDTGRGMTKEEINRLGEPYFSSKVTGTGLGMMVVYSILKNMNGSLHVESEIGKGTEFTIYIPIIK